jgi:protein phosphatase PTC7
VRAGDAVVLATDGLWDNLFEAEIGAAVAALRGGGPDARAAAAAAAERLALAANARALNTTCASPFAQRARESGFQYAGGKPDDITVVVALVTDAAPERS